MKIEFYDGSVIDGEYCEGCKFPKKYEDLKEGLCPICLAQFRWEGGEGPKPANPPNNGYRGRDYILERRKMEVYRGWHTETIKKNEQFCSQFTLGGEEKFFIADSQEESEKKMREFIDLLEGIHPPEEMFRVKKYGKYPIPELPDDLPSEINIYFVSGEAHRKHRGWRTIPLVKGWEKCGKPLMRFISQKVENHGYGNFTDFSTALEVRIVRTWFPEETAKYYCVCDVTRAIASSEEPYDCYPISIVREGEFVNDGYIREKCRMAFRVSDMREVRLRQNKDSYETRYRKTVYGKQKYYLYPVEFVGVKKESRTALCVAKTWGDCPDDTPVGSRWVPNREPDWQKNGVKIWAVPCSHCGHTAYVRVAPHEQDWE